MECRGDGGEGCRSPNLPTPSGSVICGVALGRGKGGGMYQDVPMLDLDYPQLVFTIFPFPESDSEGFPFNPYRGRAQGCALGESSADGSGWPPDGS